MSASLSLRVAFGLAGLPWLLILPGACTAKDPVERAGLQVNQETREIRLGAIFHRKNAEAGTWHLLVKEGGSMASLACFTTNVGPRELYESLRRLGISDANNVSSTNIAEEQIGTQGDKVRFFFLWSGLPAAIPLEDLLLEEVPAAAQGEALKGLEMRVGGNFTGEDAGSPPAERSGCLACLYTCSAGVISNAKANLTLLRRDKGQYRYRLSPKVALADGARVEVIVKN